MNNMARLFSISREEEEQQAEQRLADQATQSNQPAQPEQTTANQTTSDTPEVIDGEKASKFSASIVICGYPAIGKSTFARDKANNSLDLESSMYSRNQDGTRNEEFPGNYIKILKWHLVNMNYKYIFMACHDVVRQALKDDNIDFVIVYPTKDRKEEILNLCRERGNHEEFLNKLSENWDTWISQLEQEPNSYALGPGEFFTNEIIDTKLKFLKR